MVSTLADPVESPRRRPADWPGPHEFRLGLPKTRSVSEPVFRTRRPPLFRCRPRLGLAPAARTRAARAVQQSFDTAAAWSSSDWTAAAARRTSPHRLPAGCSWHPLERRAGAEIDMTAHRLGRRRCTNRPVYCPSKPNVFNVDTHTRAHRLTALCPGLPG